MNLQETIESAIRNYPAIFPSRTSVLDHLLCVIGNGYEWKDGELVDKFIEEERTEEEAIWARNPPFTNEMIEMLSENEEGDRILREMTESWELRVAGYKKIRDEYLIRAAPDYPEEKFTHWYPINKYSGIFTFPDDIKPDWAEGIRETAHKILDTTYEEWADSYNEQYHEAWWQSCLHYARLALERLDEIDGQSIRNRTVAHRGDI